MEKIKVDLAGRSTNRIQPFIMISGDDSEAEVFKKFADLKAVGIYSAVLQYSGPKKPVTDAPMSGLMQLSKFDDIYFQTLEYMVLACRRLNMTFWVQDAAPFPTGSANGAFMEPGNIQKGKLYLEERHTNIRGPLKNADILVENFNGLPRGSVPEMMADLQPQGPEAAQRGKLLGAVLVKYACWENGSLRFDGSTAMDVTDRILADPGVIRLDVPEGLWRLFFFYETHRGGRKYYMNLLDRESVRFQIDRVLQPHYEKLKGELGKTWEGFFYDEPEVGNANYYDFHCLPGYHPDRTPVALPWCGGMEGDLRERVGGGMGDELGQQPGGGIGGALSDHPDRGWLRLLPALWYDCGDEGHFMRFHYMDVVTRRIMDNYNGQIFPWCRERGIGYMGHVLEDENSHGRLGCGTGHFFRTEKYQDLSGVDLIAGQLLPGMDMYGICNYAVADGDGSFYHYGLAKLASSEDHINPLKKGSFCEVNAVYGDMTNGKFYKYLLDHLFANGVKQLIPVITDSLDTDAAKLLWPYANRMCGLLEGSTPVVPAAIVYHGESEWSGRFQYFQKPARELAAHQIDYDVIPGDALVDRDFYKTYIAAGTLATNGDAVPANGSAHGKLIINGISYGALIIPYCEFIRKDVFDFVLEAMDSHVPVYFVDGLPEGYCEMPGTPDWQGRHVCPVHLEDLAAALRGAGIADIDCSTEEPYLKYAHWQKNGMDYYMLTNGEPERTITTAITFPTDRPSALYDVMDQKLFRVTGDVCDGKTRIPVSLGKYESRVYVFGVRPEACRELLSDPRESLPATKLHTPWEVTIDNGQPGERTLRLEHLTDLSQLEGMERYTDPVRYKTEFTVDGALPALLDLGNVCDSADVRLNGQPVGLRIAAPYIYDISEAVRCGANTLEIFVCPPMARRRLGAVPLPFQQMSAATYAVMPPIGLLGPVVLYG